jgi:hypothetical protein
VNAVQKVDNTDVFGLAPVNDIAGLAGALARAQAEIKAAVKESENPAYKTGGKVSKYADLGAVWEACRVPLCKNGLSIVQTTDFDKDDVWLVTTLLHASGEKISGRYPLRPTKIDPQGFGSALTYARRYTIAAMVGVVADEDDDGNRASGNGHSNGNGHGKISELQVSTLRGMIANANADLEKFCEYLKVKSLADLPVSEYGRALDALNAKIRAGQK